MPRRAEDAGRRSELEEAGRLLPRAPREPCPQTLHPNPVVPTLDFWLPELLFYQFVLIYRKLVRRGMNNPRAQRLNRQSVILAWGLWAGRSAQLTRPGSQGAGPVPPPPSSWDRRAGLGDALCAGRAEGAV